VAEEEPVEAVATVLRRGRRSATCAVELTTRGGAHVGTGAIGFAKVPRRETDPPKPKVTPERFSALFSAEATLDRPLREAAGIEVLDAAKGEAELTVTAELRNPAGTLQGALVALLAEAAAEDLVTTRFESPAVVTDIDLRYLAQAQVGPVRSSSRLLGTGPDAPVEVRLTDASAGRLTTLVFARLSPVRP
jgi:acyl-coenzyme A thioesterase PaaI-like protein